MTERKLPGSFDTLFLDRDGTINRRKEDGYIESWKEFEFLPGVLEAMYHFSEIFKYIIIVTNQQGIGKELMTHEELGRIHEKMVSEISGAGGRVDQIYYCPHLSIFDPLCRKPNPGMAIQAKEDFPDIDFSLSIIIGDDESDVLFGKRLGMFTVRLTGEKAVRESQADLICKDLLTFCQMIDMKGRHDK